MISVIISPPPVMPAPPPGTPARVSRVPARRSPQCRCSPGPHERPHARERIITLALLTHAMSPARPACPPATHARHARTPNTTRRPRAGTAPCALSRRRPRSREPCGRCVRLRATSSTLVHTHAHTHTHTLTHTHTHSAASMSAGICTAATTVLRRRRTQFPVSPALLERDLHARQKRPTHTYTYGKRDLHIL